MTIWRSIEDDGAGAADGLAADEALMAHHGRDSAAPWDATLRLYTYRSHTALVGRYQSIEDEIDLVACRRQGIEYGRRSTGGGAIVMGAGQLGVAVATRAPAGCSPRELLERYSGGVAAGLRRLGIEARFRGKNDLAVDGRKIAGLGLYLDERGALLFHASVLADLDIPLMLSVLRIPGAKLSDKGVARVSDRITTVTAQTGAAIDGAALREHVRAGFAEALGVELRAGRLDGTERGRAAELAAQRYGAREWIFQRSRQRDARGTAVLKTPEGLARVYVGVHGDAIKSALIAGDFNVVPASLTALEAALRWCHADPARIADATAAAGVEPELGIEPGALAAAVWEATARALERARGAHPVRPDGSCYFPEKEAVA